MSASTTATTTSSRNSSESATNDFGQVRALMLGVRDLVQATEKEHKHWLQKFERLQSSSAQLDVLDLAAHLAARTTLSSLTQNSNSDTSNNSTDNNINNNLSGSHTATASPIDDPSTATISSVTTASSNAAPTARTSSSTNSKPPSYRTAIGPTLPNHVNEPLNHPTPPIRTRRRATFTYNTGAIAQSLISGSVMASNTSARGALIVLEGLDRVGKSTVVKSLAEHFERVRKPAVSLRFPDRSTPTGKLINEFLQSKTKHVDDHAMHLLFSANRWEARQRIINTINQGKTVILDRYSYSGIAYSSAKAPLTLAWCCETERGLPKPDLVIYLELGEDAQNKREGFGDERYETREYQNSVRKQYERLIKITRENWLRVNVENKSPDEILGEILIPVKSCLESCASKELGTLDFH